MISKIEEVEKGFYQKNQEKIIFAISVHSIECWIFHLFNKEKLKSGRVKDCEIFLANTLNRDKRLKNFTKAHPIKKRFRAMKKEGKDNYMHLSSDFAKKKGINITNVRKVDVNFDAFILNLEAINYSPDEE